MMRRAKRSSIVERAAFDFSRDRGDHRYFKQFCGRKRWQNRWQAGREHRLARTRRPDHEKIMSASGSDLERALGTFLPLDIRETERAAFELANPGLWTCQNLRTFEMVGELDQRLHGNDRDFVAGPGCFSTGCWGTDQSLSAPVGADRSRQYACNWRDRAVEAEFSQDGEAAQCIVRDGANRCHKPERDRQIVMTS